LLLLLLLPLLLLLLLLFLLLVFFVAWAAAAASAAAAAAAAAAGAGAVAAGSVADVSCYRFIPSFVTCSAGSGWRRELCGLSLDGCIPATFQCYCIQPASAL